MRAAGTVASFGELQNRVRAVLADQFDVGEQVGLGGMSVVFFATRKSDGRPIALKVLRDDRAEDPELVEHFRLEAMVSEPLSHPGLVSTYSIHEIPPRSVAIATEFVDGGTLSGFLKNRGPLPADLAIKVLKDTASALQYIHSQGIIHRDIKPDNVLIDFASGWFKVSDFGIASSEGMPQASGAGLTVGTPAYMSPEQISGGQVVPQSDLYSLGMMGWQLFTGLQPWAGETMSAIVKRQMNDALPPVSSLRSDVPAEVEAILAQCMAKDVGARPGSASEILKVLAPFPERDIRAALLPDQQPAVAPAGRTGTSAGRRAPAQRPAGGLPKPVVAGVLGVGILGAIAVFGLSGNRGEESPGAAGAASQNDPAWETVGLPADPFSWMALDPIDDSGPPEVVQPESRDDGPVAPPAVPVSPTPSAAAPAQTQVQRPGTLAVSVQGSWAFVSVDGAAPMETPMQMELLPGTYQLRVFRPGFQDIVTSVRIGSGERVNRVLTLTPSG